MAALSTQLLVIGGGATGLGVAWDACLRGLKVVLVEQSDLGQGTSGRYHGLLHSGGRYVLSDPVSATDCAQENRILRRIAPSTIEDTGGVFVAAPGDPPPFPDAWRAAADRTGVVAEEINLGALLHREPLLNPGITRAFQVQDAALDSFDLLHLIVASLRARGGQVWLHHRVDGLLLDAGRVTGARITNLATGEASTVGAELVVNAAGPWARKIAAMAKVDLPIALGKGTMVAMATRLVQTVVNRCKPPADGDIIVPVGTVAVLGTTDVPVQDPDDLTIEPWEIDLLMAEGEILIPTLGSHRALRAWAGVRPLYRPTPAIGPDTRSLPRAHSIIDHSTTDGGPGLVSVIGGKLTTFRLMAEQTVDGFAAQLGVSAVCTTKVVLLESPGRPPHRLPDRLATTETRTASDQPPGVLCECELITRADIEAAMQSDGTGDLDDIRRDLRLGMGPCQAGFCAYRAAGVAAAASDSDRGDAGWAAFLQERWRGLRPLAWGQSLRQMELSRRVTVELLGALAPAQELR
jgi:glycerol-3-phosphate dehydrogenase